MKKRLIKAITGGMAIMMVLTGCNVSDVFRPTINITTKQAGESEPEKNSDVSSVAATNATLAENVVTAAEGSFYEPVEIMSGDQLSEAELQQFQDYFNRIDNYQFAYQTYRSPEDLNYDVILFHGAGIENCEYSEATVKPYYVDNGYFDSSKDEFVVLKVKDVKEYIKNKTGIEDFDITLLTQFDYIESEDILFRQIKNRDYDKNIVCKEGVRNGDYIQIIVSYSDTNRYDRRITLLDTKNPENPYQYICNRQLWEKENDEIIQASVYGSDEKVTCGLTTDDNGNGPKIDVIEDYRSIVTLTPTPDIVKGMDCTDIKEVTFCDLDGDEINDVLAILSYGEKDVAVIYMAGYESARKTTSFKWVDGYTDWINDNVENVTADNVINFVLEHKTDVYNPFYYVTDDDEGEKPGDWAEGEDPLKGLVADDILEKFRASNPVNRENTLYGEAKALGNWVYETIGRENISNELLEKSHLIGAGYEFCFGTGADYDDYDRIKYIYGEYYTLKAYYASEGTQHLTYFRELQEWNYDISDGNPDNINRMYVDLQEFVSECNNIIRQ